MVLIGILIVFIASYLTNYLLTQNFLKQQLTGLPLPYEFFVVVIVFSIAFLIYYLVQRFLFNRYIGEVKKLNDELEKFQKTKQFQIQKTKNPLLLKAYKLLDDIFNKVLQEEEEFKKQISQLKYDINKLEEIIELENVFVLKVNEDGKIILSNKRFLKFLAVESETKFNMKFKSIKELFENNPISGNFIDYTEKEIPVVIKGVKFSLYIAKVEKEMEYVLTLIDVTKFEQEKNELVKKTQYIGKNLKSIFVINKTLETTMIRVLNYENYFEHLGQGIIEVFEEKFVEKIVSLGYQDVFKAQNGIFAVYDFNVDFDKYKKILEETIVVSVADKEYMFNPKVVLASGVNFDQAYQQIIESSKTMKSKKKDSVKYDLETIAFINKTILNNNVLLGYQPIENEKNTIIISPVIEDEYGSKLDQNLVNDISRELNLYLYMLKEIIINNLNLLKNYKIILNVTTQDLLSTTILIDLLTLIKREELLVTFNIKINSDYNVILPILKQLKSYAQIGFKNIGNGYVSFRDVYALKIEYIEIDDTIIQLINTNPQWKFLLDSVKILVSAQKTKLLANNYKDEKVLRISNDIKVYKN